jgi:chromosome segregation ATPase
VQEKATKKEIEYTEAERQLSNPTTVEEEKKSKLDELLAEAQEHRALKADLEDELLKLQVPYRAKERELQSIQQKREKGEKKLANARRSLQKARDQIMERAGAAESEGARRAQLLKRTEDDLAVAQQQVHELTQAVSTSYRSYESIEPRVHDARSKTRSVFNQLKGIRATINELDKSSGESLAIWGKNVTKVYKLVRQSLRFHGSLCSLISNLTSTVLFFRLMRRNDLAGFKVL